MSRRQLLMATGSLVAVWLLVAGAWAASLAGFDLGWHVIVGGGGRSSSANYAVDGSIGQPAVGESSSVGSQLSAGFWPGAIVVLSPTATVTPSASPTGTPPPTVTRTPTATATSIATRTPTATPSPASTPTATPTGTVSPTPGYRIYLPIVLKSYP
jgi:hypothetical protein